MPQSSVRIVTDVHDEPHIEGRHVTVRRIQGLAEGAGKSAEEVADQLDVDVADVYGALHTTVTPTRWSRSSASGWNARLRRGRRARCRCRS